MSVAGVIGVLPFMVFTLLVQRHLVRGPVRRKGLPLRPRQLNLDLGDDAL
jgi:hypothetical protein